MRKKRAGDKPKKVRVKNNAGLNFNRRRKQIDLERFRGISILGIEIALVLLLSFFCVRGFGMRFTVLGNSMEPTLYEGDSLLINRVAYRLGTPHHNDVVAFLPEGNLNAQYSIKRVVGVPGDRIMITNGSLYVNGERYRDSADTASIIEAGRAGSEITLGEDEYFVLGDNRNSSEDSRYETIGNVGINEIYGKLWFNVSADRFGFIE